MRFFRRIRRRRRARKHFGSDRYKLGLYGMCAVFCLAFSFIMHLLDS